MKARILATIVGTVLWATGASAVPIVYETDLTGGAENPANGSTATGHAIVTLDVVAHTLRVEVIFAGLSAPTSDAHIHCCVAPPGNVGVAIPGAGAFPGFPLGVTAGNYDNVFDLTQSTSFRPAFIANFGGGTAAGAEAALAAGLAAGQAYVNIHTTNFPAGEIRGFPDEVPEPASLALLGAGLTALLAMRRARAV